MADSFKQRFKLAFSSALAWVGEQVQFWFERWYCLHADSAYQIQYRQEYIVQFEAHATLLRDTVTTEATIKGQQAVFLVAGSGSATAVSRGLNGRIPARSDSLTQNTCTLQEWHDLVRKTGFNIFASQGNQRAIMQMSSVGVLNRKIDSTITTELNNGTISIGSGAGQIPNVSLVMNALVKLQNASVPWDNNICLLCQPSFIAYLMQAPEWTSALFVDNKTLDGNDANWKDKPSMWRWMNMMVVAHPNLPGKGTTTETSFMYHKSAIGHAMDTAGLQTPVGYFEEQDYSWARATAYMGAKLLQNSGVVLLSHDGSAYA